MKTRYHLKIEFAYRLSARGRNHLSLPHVNVIHADQHVDCQSEIQNLPPMQFSKQKAELSAGQYRKVEVSRPDVPEETHFKGSQLQLII